MDTINGMQLFRNNHAGAMVLKNGHTVNYGVIKKDHEKVLYYTGKGLREMWKPTMTEDEKIEAARLKRIEKEEGGVQKLIKSGHIAMTYYRDIERILF